MKKYLTILISAIISGFCITIGVCAYLNMLHLNNKLVGSLMFGLGLFTIIHFNFWLYTGKAGFVLDNKPKYLIDLIVCLIGNLIGVIVLSSIISLTRYGAILHEQAALLVEQKQNDTWYSIFIQSIMCGIMIYLAVAGHKKYEYSLGKVLFCFLAVSIFIICGFEHCVANASYYTFAKIFNLKTFFYFILMIIGNACGSIIFDGLLKLMDKIKSQEQNSWLLILIFNYLIINSVSSSNKWQWFISNTSFNGWPGAKSSLDGTDAIIGSPSIAV